MTNDDGDDLGPWAAFGRAVERLGATAVEAEGVGATTGFGPNPDDSHDLDGLPAVTGFGGAATIGTQADGALHDAAVGMTEARFGETLRDVTAAVKAETPAPLPHGYHPRVDADGDGHHDHATYQSDGHGGAEILVDLNHDGKVDFVGHDTNLDGKVDFADYDTDNDGIFDKRMYDTNHDGILDHTEWLHDGS